MGKGAKQGMSNLEDHFNNSDKEKQSFVSSVFSAVSKKYDLMNDAMSLGLHRLWKKRFVSQVSVKPGMKYLDVACGTGDITEELIKTLERRNIEAEVTLTDINPEMLKEGKEKFIDHNILWPVQWVEADAQALPFDDNSFDVVTIAFGLRNVPDKQKALSEFKRVLKPGGQFLCLEFSHVQNEWLDKAYQLYSDFIIPKFGKVIAKNEEAYEYLVESIRRFPDQNELKKTMDEVGFFRTSYQNIHEGIVSIHEGWA